MDRKIETLRQKLLSSKELDEPNNYFLNNMVGNGDFDERSKELNQEEASELLKILEPMLARTFRVDINSALFIPVRYKKTQLIHGMLRFPDSIFTIIYFEEDIIGLITCVGLPSMTNVDYMRITSFKTDKPINMAGDVKIISRSNDQEH